MCLVLIFFIITFFAISCVAGFEFFLRLRCSLAIDKLIFYKYDWSKLDEVDRYYLDFDKTYMFFSDYVIPKNKLINILSYDVKNEFGYSFHIFNYLNNKNYKELESLLIKIIKSSFNTRFAQHLFNFAKENKIDLDQKKILMTMHNSNLSRRDFYNFLQNIDSNPEIEKLKLLL
jgi:hypothetical protein